MSKLMEKLLDRADGIVGNLSALGAVAAGISTVAMVFVVTGYVIARAFGTAWVFVEEWGGYLLVLMTYVGAAYALRKGSHIQMKLVLDNVPVRTRMLLSVFFSLVSIPLIGCLTWLSVLRVIDNIKIGARSLYFMETPLWIPSLFIPIGLGLLFLALVFYFVRAVIAVMSRVPEVKEESTTGMDVGAG